MPVGDPVKLALNRADYALMFVMAVIVSYTLGFYPFYCNPQFQLVQMLGCGVASALNVVWALTPVYRKSHQARLLRVLLSAAVVTLALLPVFYTAATSTGWYAPYYPAAWGLAAWAFFPIGALVWVLHFPEKWIPRVFDCNMNSHAWMHLCVVVSHLLFYAFNFQGYRAMKAKGFVCE